MKINGSLVFDASSASEIQNLRVQKVSSNPTHVSADIGRLIYNTTDNVIYIGGATAWIALATGGNAAALQNEVDAIETTLGALINSSGNFVASAFSGFTNVTTPTDLFNVLQQLDAAVSGKDALAELTDVTLTTPSNGQYLRYQDGDWINDTIDTTDISGVTASAAELNILDGATLSTTELNYVDGVTSSIQDQLNNKQPLDGDLTNLAALGTTGIAVRTNNGTEAWDTRSLVQPTAGITITNADGVTGNPTFALADDLAALEGLTGTGYIVRTADGAATNRSIDGTSGRVVVTNGDGVASNTNVDLATVTLADTGSFKKITVDSYGRVSGTTDVTQGDITTLVSSVYVDVAGDTMTGNLVMSSGATVTGLPSPAADTDAASKAYVDAVAAGLTWKNAVNVISITDVALTGTTPLTIDGHTLNDGERVLLAGQTDGTQDGIYVVGITGGNYTLTRATDADVYTELLGATVFVQQGTVYADTGWTQSATLTSFDNQNWVQFSGASAYTWGEGLSITGNTVNVNLGAGIAQLPSDEVGIDVVSNLALQLTSTATNGQLTFVLDAGSGLEQSAAGLKISASGVTNAMLQNDSFTLNADTGTGSAALGDTVLIEGNAVQGIDTSVTGTNFTITARDASSSQKGVASFNATEFSVTAGAVALGTVPISKLDQPHFSVSDGTTSDQIGLNETLSILGDSASGVDTTTGANSITISVGDATTTQKGVASFNSSDFTVTSGAVSVIAKNLDSLTDVAVSAPSAGQTLVYNGTNFVNRKVFHVETVAVAATEWVVNHGIGQKFCNVTVADSSDEVVIPQSITFNSTSQLTVTFNTAITGTVMVSGVNAAA